MRKKRILIVDDEPSFMRLLKLALEKKGEYVVQEEKDSTQALEAAKRFKPDLVILDFVMPLAHGGDVAAQIRIEERFRETPILFLTGSIPKRRGEQKIADFQALAKPIGLDELIVAIESNLALAADRSKESQNWLPRSLQNLKSSLLGKDSED